MDTCIFFNESGNSCKLFEGNLEKMLKLKTHLFSANKTINKMKRQPSEWENIIENNATDKGLISRIYKQLNIRKTTQSKNGQSQGTQTGALYKPRGVGWGGRWEGGSTGRGHM